MFVMLLVFLYSQADIRDYIEYAAVIIVSSNHLIFYVDI